MFLFSLLLSRRMRQQEQLHAMGLSICSSVCLSVAKMQKTRFSQKLSNLELRCLLTTHRKLHMGFQRTHYRTPKIQDGGDPPSWILTPKCKNAIFWKLSNLVSCNFGFFKASIIGSLQSKMDEIRHLENRYDVIFSAEGGPISIKLRRLVQNDVLFVALLMPYLAASAELLQKKLCYNCCVVNVFQFCYMALRLVHQGKLI